MPHEREGNGTDESPGEGSVHLSSGKNIALFQMNIQHNFLFFWGASRELSSLDLGFQQFIPSALTTEANALVHK